MQALRRINNNVALCRDGSGRELIAMGKGVGFGSFPRELALSEIERTFYDTDEKYRQLVAELPEDVLAFAARIVEIAGNELPYALSPNAAFTLADHISFAMERARKNIRVKMPLAYDVEQLYPAEYRIAQHAIRRIRKEFPDAEKRRAVLAAQGGVSWAAVIGAFVLLMMVGACCTLLLGPNLDALAGML